MRSRRIALSLFLTAASTAAVGCHSEKAEQARSCPPDCDQPKVPAGVPGFKVVKDESKGSSDAQDVTIRVVLKQKTKRADIYPSLQFLYRYAVQRGTFPPKNFTGEFYTSESEAASGTSPVAKIWKLQADQGPKCENAIKMELPEEVDRAFAHSINRGEEEDLEDSCHLNEKKKVARVDDNFKHKPTYKLDEGTKSVEVQFPYLESGKDEYAKSLTFNEAMTYFSEFMNTMFQKAPDLQQITYVGVLDDQPALKVTVTRQEYDAKLSTLQETIASYSAIIFAKLGLHKTDDKGAKAEQEAHSNEVYKQALAMLPKDHVFISPKLVMAKGGKAGKGGGKHKKK